MVCCTDDQNVFIFIFGSLSLSLFLSLSLGARDDSSKTPFLQASEKDHLDEMKCLVEEGANIEAQKGYYDRTSLVCASMNGHLDGHRPLSLKVPFIEFKFEVKFSTLLICTLL